MASPSGLTRSLLGGETVVRFHGCNQIRENMKRYKITRRLRGLDFQEINNGWERTKPLNKPSKYYWDQRFNRYNWYNQALRIEYKDNEFVLFKTGRSDRWVPLTFDEDLDVIINYIEYWLKDHRSKGRKNEWWFHSREYLESKGLI